MNTATLTPSDFTPDQCRNALADFDKTTVEQAVAVMSSRNEQMIARATNHPEFSRAVFWVREWANAEGINSRRQALKKLRDIQLIRIQRRTQLRNAAMTVFIVAGIAAQTALWAII